MPGLTLKLKYGPVFSVVDAPMVVKEGLLASLRVKNPDFDANVHDPDDIPPYCEFFEKDEGLIFTGLAGMFLVWAKRRNYSVELEGWPCDPIEGWTTTLPEVDPNILPGIVLKPYQVDALRRALKYGRGVLEMATGSGKCLGVDVPVLLYSGDTKKAQDIQVGDVLMGPDSLPRRVLSTCVGHGPMYEIVSHTRISWTCNSNHVLTLVRTNQGIGKKDGLIEDVPLGDYLSSSKSDKNLWKQFSVGVEWSNTSSLSVDPYFVGLWIGDGTKKRNKRGELEQITITTQDKDVEIVSYLRDIAEKNSLKLIRRLYTLGACPSWALSSGCIGGKNRNSLLCGMRKLFPADSFEIPKIYLLSSRKNRLSLLAGLIDSDGYCHNKCFEISTKSDVLCKDILFLCRSLGFRSISAKKISTCQNGFVGIYNRISISGNLSEVPTLLKRKRCSLRIQKKNVQRTGISVSPIGLGKYAGFQVDGDGRFLLGDFTVTHNSEVAIAFTRVLGTPKTLYLVPDCAAMHQVYERYLKRGFNEGEVGRLGDSLYEMDKMVIVAVINSVYSGIKSRDTVVLDLLENCELFIADEVHHQATAVTWQIVAIQCKAERRFGLSGTPYKDAASRFNPHYIHPYDTFLTGLLGPTLIYVPPEKLQEMGELAPCTVVSFAAGGEEVQTGPIYNSWVAKALWRTVYKKGIIENDERNHRICILAANISDMGGFPLISVEVLEHGRGLQRCLWEDHGIASVCSYGSGVRFVPREFAEILKIPFEDIPIYNRPVTAKNKKSKNPPKQVGVEEGYVQISSRVDIFWHIQRGDLKVLIGSRIYDEAMDVPFLSDLINAAGGKAEQRFRQKVGRVLRRADGKGVARIWEPWDTCHGVLLKHSQERIAAATGQGWPVIAAQQDYLDWMYEIRAKKLNFGEKVTVKLNRIEIGISQTIPTSFGDPADRFSCIKPSFTIGAELEDGDNVDECVKKLSTLAKAHFMMEAARQSGILESFKKRGFVEATKEYLKTLEVAGSIV